MSPAMATVSSILVRPLAAVVPADALPAFWRATGLTPPLIADADARLTAAQFCVAWAEAQRLTGDRTLALRLAAGMPAGAFGIVEYVCRAAPTLGVALRQWARYLGLLDAALTMALVDLGGDDVALRIVRESDAPAPGAHELCFAIVARYARELTAAPVRVTRVEFRHPAPRDVAPFRAAFEAPVVFGADVTQLVLPAAALAAPMRGADPMLLGILQRAAAELLAALPTDASAAAQVARVLHAQLRDADTGIDQAAAALGTTSRSLQRRLRDEGTSFNDVREQVRRELAQRYLKDGLAIAEISFLLGFSEPSAFFRAFKRWTGATPQTMRAAAPA